MTMPTLIQNYQKQVLVTQLKKSYSLWSQTFQKILADEGVSRLSDTQLWSYIEGNGCSNMPGEGDACARTKFIPELKKYIKFEGIMGKVEYGSYKNKEAYLIKTNDGTILRYFIFYKTVSRKDTETCNKIKELGGNMCSYVGSLTIDVNGHRGPNDIGIDIFYFSISDEGKLYPFGGKDHALYMERTDLSSNSFYWKNRNQSCENFNGCAARIMENGWKMDY